MNLKEVDQLIGQFKLAASEDIPKLVEKLVELQWAKDIGYDMALVIVADLLNELALDTAIDAKAKYNIVRQLFDKLQELGK